jgi:CheY-like chemotaxis protein
VLLVDVPIQETITGYTGERMKILVTDDKRENRLVLANILEPLGFEVFTANNGKEAIESAVANTPDMILIDLVMPVMTGFEAVRALRDMPAFTQTPIFAVSASVIDMDDEKTQLAGCNGFISKPVDMDLLFKMMVKWLPIEWTYANSIEEETAQPKRDTGPLIAPPQEELEALYEYALLGRMKPIKERLDQLDQLDGRYKSFTEKVRGLANDFNDKQIIKLIEKLMELNNGNT